MVQWKLKLGVSAKRIRTVRTRKDVCHGFRRVEARWEQIVRERSEGEWGVVEGLDGKHGRDEGRGHAQGRQGGGGLRGDSLGVSTEVLGQRRVIVGGHAAARAAHVRPHNAVGDQRHACEAETEPQRVPGAVWQRRLVRYFIAVCKELPTSELIRFVATRLLVFLLWSSTTIFTRHNT